MEHPIFFFPPKILEHRYGEFFLTSVHKTFNRAVEEFKPDAILSCWAHPDGWAAVQLGREHDLPVVIKLIGTDVLVLSRRPRRRVRIVEALQGADQLIVVSKDIGQHVAAMGVDSERIQLIPEGIDKSVFHRGDQASARQALGLTHNRTMFLFVGNLLVSKGLLVLAEACKILRDRGLDYRCYVAGEGRDRATIKSRVDRLGLQDCVIFVGRQPHHNLPNWYRASDVVVLPSFSEGIPNVLREAVACGRPYVATAVGGIPEISRPEFAELVPPGDAIALADAMMRRLKAPMPPSSDGHLSWEESASLVSQTLRKAKDRNRA